MTEKKTQLYEIIKLSPAHKDENKQIHEITTSIAREYPWKVCD